MYAYRYACIHAYYMHTFIQMYTEGMFYLTMHSTHFIYGYMESDMVKDHLDSQRGSCHMGYYFQLAARVILYTTYMLTYIYACIHTYMHTYICLHTFMWICVLA